jgi:putative ABC transport system permease protein
LGVGGSIGVSYVLRGWLFGVRPVDGVTLGSGVLILGSVAILASLIPALKAARTDPQQTLKVE